MNRKSAGLPSRPAEDRTSVETGGTVAGRLGLWAVLAGVTGAGVAIALRRSKAKADATASAADRGAPVPGGDQLAASFKAQEYLRERSQPAAHLAMTADEYEYDRHGATVLGSAHPAPHAGHARSSPMPHPSVDEEPGREGTA